MGFRSWGWAFLGLNLSDAGFPPKKTNLIANFHFFQFFTFFVRVASWSLFSHFFIFKHCMVAAGIPVRFFM